MYKKQNKSGKNQVTNAGCRGPTKRKKENFIVFRGISCGIELLIVVAHIYPIHESHSAM